MVGWSKGVAPAAPAASPGAGAGGGHPGR